MTQSYAIIEIGSRGVRLLVGAATPSGLAVKFADGDVANLGSGVDETGELQAQNMARALELVTEYAAAARARGASQVIAVCTEAVRKASNRDVFIGMLQPYVNRVHVLTAEQESYYAFIAANRAFPRVLASGGSSLVIDQGGGSVDLMIGKARASTPPYRSSLPLGTVTLSEILLTAPAFSRAREEIGERIEDAFSDEVLSELGRFGMPSAVLGMGSSVTKLAQRAYLEQHGQRPRLGDLHGYMLPHDTISRFLDRFEAQFGEVAGPLGASALLQRDPDIATIYVGIRVFEFVLDTVGGEAVILSRHGVAHGLLLAIAERAQSASVKGASG